MGNSIGKEISYESLIPTPSNMGDQIGTNSNPSIMETMDTVDIVDTVETVEETDPCFDRVTSHRRNC